MLQIAAQALFAWLALAYHRFDDTRRLADHLRSRNEPRNRQGHRLHHADAVSAEVTAPAGRQDGPDRQATPEGEARSRPH